MDPTTKELGGVSEQFKSALADLTGVLKAHEGCWGEDQIGKAFERKYQGPADDVKEYAADTDETVSKLPGILKKAAESFQQVDADGAKRIDQSLADQLENPTE